MNHRHFAAINRLWVAAVLVGQLLCITGTPAISQRVEPLLSPVVEQGAQASALTRFTQEIAALAALSSADTASVAADQIAGLSTQTLAQHQQQVRLLGEQVQRGLAQTSDKLNALQQAGKISAAISERHKTVMQQFATSLARLNAVLDALAVDTQPLTGDALAMLHGALTPLANHIQPQTFGVTIPPPAVAMRVAALAATAAVAPRVEQPVFEPPTAADLAQTLEVQFTPEISALAATLHNNSSEIYDYVHNELRFEPYFGSVRGGEHTLLAKAGNDYDLASLTIALLRAAAIPARYITGTVEIPTDKAANIVGFQNVEAATAMYASSNALKVAGPSGFQLTMTWVIAYVNGEWVHLVPWYKTNIIYAGADLASIGHIQGDRLMALATAGATSNAGESYYTNVNGKALQDALATSSAQITEYILDNYAPHTPLQEILGGVKIQTRTNLPFNLPFTLVTTPDAYNQIPDAVRYKVHVSSPGIDLTLTLAELAGKRISLSYSAATQADQNVINAHGGMFATPPYLVKVRPTLWLDGTPRDSGDALTLGTEHALTISLLDPQTGNVSITRTFTAGAYYNLYLPVARTTPALVQKQYAILQATQARAASGQQVTRDELLGQLLYLQSLTYWSQRDSTTELAANLQDVRWARRPGAVTIVAAAVATNYSGNTPVELSPARSVIDIPTLGSADIGIGDAPTQEAAHIAEHGWFRLLGPIGSAGEHLVFETAKQTPAYSTAKILQLANQQGIRIYHINQANLATALAALEQETWLKSTITQHVNAGYEVIVPQKPVPYHGEALVGWVWQDKTSGAGSWMIRTSLFGGNSLEDKPSLLLDLIKGLADIGDNLYESIVIDDGFEVRRDLRAVGGKAQEVAGKLGKVIKVAETTVKVATTAVDVYTGQKTGYDVLDIVGKEIVSAAAGIAAGAIIVGTIGVGTEAIVVGAAVVVASTAASWATEAAYDKYLEYVNNKIPSHSNPNPNTSVAFPASLALTTPTWFDTFADTTLVRRMERTQLMPGQVELSHMRAQGIVMANGQRIDNLVVTLDNQLYGTVWPDGHLFRYDPATQIIQDLGSAVPGAMHLWALVQGVNGKLYASTGNGTIGYLLAFDLATQQWQNLGIPLAGSGAIPTAETDVVALARDATGRIYGGTYPHGYFFVFDPTTATSTFKAIPVAGEEAINTLVVGTDGKVYGTTSPNAHLFTYDPATNGLTVLEPIAPSGPLLRILTRDATGIIYGVTSPDGHLFAYDPTTNALTDKGMPVPGETSIHTLSAGADGLLWGSTGPIGHLFAWNPTTNSTVFMELVDQSELYVSALAMGAKGQVFMGTTGNAKLLTYDPMAYQAASSITSVAIALPQGQRWHSLAYEATTPTNTAITVDVLAANGALLLSNVASGQSLNGINPTDYPRLKLKANLTTADVTQSPVLLGWSVTLTQTAPVAYLPLIARAVVSEIRGSVTLDGAPVANVTVTLTQADAETARRARTSVEATQHWRLPVQATTAHDVIATTTTNADGSYLFSGLPSLPDGYDYEVIYVNREHTAGRLGSYTSRSIPVFAQGDVVNLEPFDIADIVLTAPPANAHVKSPYIFRWVPRPTTSSDDYRIFIAAGLGVISPQLGYTNLVIVFREEFPQVIVSGQPYSWSVVVVDRAGGYGYSAQERTIIFE